MELCEGGELFDLIVRKGHYMERAAANITKIMLQVCKVLSFSSHFFLLIYVASVKFLIYKCTFLYIYISKQYLFECENRFATNME